MFQCSQFACHPSGESQNFRCMAAKRGAKKYNFTGCDKISFTNKCQYFSILAQVPGHCPFIFTNNDPGYLALSARYIKI